ncbi:TolC family protein [Rhodocyclus tenuis]|uniref:TolC family protein n=1 Tax=Rhodocyclus tenuis TaxID=1066 RepID=UPI001908A3A4|nr:TolC family protein [Rhodocyclus tenuis]MBK1679250.1 hypothetical protein [Rhodocyclus tenuis]
MPYTSRRALPAHCPLKLTLAVIGAFAALSIAAVPGARANGFDPFPVAALTPPPAAASNGLPCQEPTAEHALSLVNVVDEALCHNPQTREAWANARWRAAQVGVAQAAWLPTLAATLSTSRIRPDTSLAREDYNQQKSALTLSWLLWDFGGRSATLESARQLLAAASETQSSTLQSVFLAAVQAFYQVHANTAALAATRESERAAGESLRAAEARYRVGTGTPADRLQAQTAYSQATLARISAEGSLQTAYGTLANVIGRDAQRAAPLAPVLDPAPDARFERDVGALIDEARRQRPDLRASEAQLASAEADIAAARAAGLPTLSLVAAANNTDSSLGSTTRDGSLGVRVDIPVFSGFATHYRVRSAEEQRAIKAAQLEKTRLQVSLDVWNAYQNLVTATQSVKSAADLLASAEQSARVARGRYEAGVGTLIELLNAQSALASARLQDVQAKFAWRTGRATLAQAIGVLDGSLLQLPPAAAGNLPAAEPILPATPLTDTKVSP